MKTAEANRQYMRQWRKKNREQHNLLNRQFRQRHLERLRAKDRARDKLRVRVRPKQKLYCREYRAKHLERLLKQGRLHYAKNRERLLEWKRQHPGDKEHKRRYNREWCRRNPARVQFQRAKRKYGCVATKEELQRINDFILRIRAMPIVHCNYCGEKIPGKKVDIDHVIPLARGGKHALFNLCASCPRCNNTKYAHLPHEWKRKGQLFLSL